jgi:hypothetical protein
MKSKTLCSILALGTAAFAASAQADDSAFKFDLHGFVSTTGYVQSNPAFVLNGQGPLLLIKEAATSGMTTTGFDVRQSRLNFSLSGPKVLGGAATKAVIETDFFNLNGPGGYGEVSVMNRLRLAYGDLNWGDTSVRFGQDWQLLFNEYPTSIAHIAFPVTYFAGLSGWRGPGVAVYHKFDMGDGKLEGAFQVLRSDWENPFDSGLSSKNLLNVSAGQLSAIPAFEGRLKYMSGDNSLYVAGHWSKVDGTKVGNLSNVTAGDTVVINTGRTWDVIEGKVGGKLVLGDLTFKGDVYIGRNTTPLIGEALTWYTNNDVSEVGGWGQLGYKLSDTWSIWGVYGQARASMDDVTAAGGGRYENVVYGGMVMYREGPFGVGPEFYHVNTKSTANSGGGATDGNMEGYQATLSANLYF